MMGRDERPQRSLFYIGINLEKRVRREHILRRVAQLVDFEFVYGEVKDRYGYNGNVSVATKYRIMRLPEVKAITGLSRSTIYFRMDLGTFPKKVNLGGRAVGWLENEIQEWLQQRIEASRETGGINGSFNEAGGINLVS